MTKDALAKNTVTPLDLPFDNDMAITMAMQLTMAIIIHNNDVKNNNVNEQWQ